MAFSYRPWFGGLTARHGLPLHSQGMNSSQRGNPDPGTPGDPPAGKGMPAKEPRAQRSRPGKQNTLKDGAVEASLELPHDRDQAVDMTDGKPNPAIEQAGRDVRKGLKDTSKAPEMDRAYKKLGS